jgi:glutaryl-CoA dehydrogenase
MDQKSPALSDVLAQLDDETREGLARHLGEADPDVLKRLAQNGFGGNGASAQKKKRERDVPPVDGDYYGIRKVLTDEQEAYCTFVRTFMEEHVRPIINDYWNRHEFPMEVVPKFGAHAEQFFGERGFGSRERSPVASGMAGMEMSRVDPSITTFFGVHTGLAMTSIFEFGSEEQKEKWLPPMERFEKIGSWALTEPEHGSDASLGLATTARREGNGWILDGKKKWSGNATIADVNVIWARSTEDGEVKGFLVERDMPGYHVEKLGDKIAKRAVDNVNITLDGVKVPEAARLSGVESFRDVSGQLGRARGGVAWEATGLAMAVYENSLEYANERLQFGKPITSFQLVQDMLVQMLGNVTAMQSMCLRLAQMQEEGTPATPGHASLAKSFCCTKMRETAAIGRGLLGGNGILLEHDVARLFADAEAVYSYEGTHEMNTLIVGREITGRSAFV